MLGSTQGRCPKYDKNGDVQKNSVFSLQNTQQAPVRRLVKVLCMRDLLYFHSHDIVGLAVTEDKEMVVVNLFDITHDIILGTSSGASR